MEKNSYTAYLIDKGADSEKIEYAVKEVEKLEHFLEKKETDLYSCTSEDIQAYMDLLIAKNENSIKSLIFLSRYFLSQKNNTIYIYFTQLLGVSGVIENILNRFEIIAEKKGLNVELKQKINNLPIGSSPKKYPDFVKSFMVVLKSFLTEDEARWVLAGNNHQIPAESFEEEKRHFMNADSIQAYLTERHLRAVKKLQQHADEGTVWFEQIITPEVVELVRSHQEMLGGIKWGNKIVLTKIPYNPSEYVITDELTQRRYMACHCPFIRNHLLQDFSDIDPDCCYCSGGFAKAPFEHIFERELHVELIESCLTGSDKCRFAITIPQEYLNEKSNF